MPITIIKNSISQKELAQYAKSSFGDFAKAVVDIAQEIMALGGELHADEEAMLLEQGSAQENLWGVNLYPDNPEESWVEYNSMINIRPSQGNRSRGVEDAVTRERIKAVVKKLVA